MKRLFLFFLVAFITTEAFSTHVKGGTIEVECNGGNTYFVTVSIYRDPTGAGLPLTLPLTIDPILAGSNTTITLVRDTIITYHQPPSTNPCLIPPPTAETEEHIFRGTMTLTAGTGYYLYWQCANCRNSTINVQGQPGVTIFAEIPNPTVYPCNNSPVFNLGPPVSVCINEPMTYDNSAIDPDGDSLVYSLCTALSNLPGTPPFSPVPYLVPYSGTYPVSSSPAISIDPNTGIITGTPNLSGLWVIAVCADEYRNGVKIGTVVREVSLWVDDCTTNANPPHASGMNGGTSYDTVICRGQQIDFEVFSTYNNTSDSLTMSWNQGISGGTYMVSSDRLPKGHFSWQPNLSDTGIFQFIVALEENSCPAFIPTEFTYTIQIRNPEIYLPHTFVVCNGKPAALDPAEVEMSIGFNQFQWSPAVGLSDPADLFTIFNPLAPTTYTLIATNGYCADTTSLAVALQHIDTTVIVAHITLTAQEPGAQYQWVDCNQGFAHIPGATAQDFQPTVSGNYAVIVTKNGCTDTSACHYVLLTGIENAGHNPRIRLYPNPARGTLYVELETNRAGNYVLQLLNPAGQMVHRESLPAGIGVNTVQMDIAHLPAGLYQVVVEGEDGRRVQKLVVME